MHSVPRWGRGRNYRTRVAALESTQGLSLPRCERVLIGLNSPSHEDQGFPEGIHRRARHHRKVHLGEMDTSRAQWVLGH